MDHTDVALRAVVRALTDVVTPAVDPHDSLACEQLRLSIDYIEFVSQRLEFFHEREVLDLRNHLDMARQLKDIVAGQDLPEGRRLDEAIGQGVAAASGNATPTRRLKAVTAVLASAVTDIVRMAPRLDRPLQARIEQAVVKATKARIEFERSWYAPLGFDPDAGDVRPLATVIADDIYDRP